MKCVDCIEKGAIDPQDAVLYLIRDNEVVLPLCQECYDEYAYMEGDMYLDSYYVEIKGIGQYEFVNGINRTLKYLNDMNTRYREKYFAAKKLAEDAIDKNAGILPDELLEVIKW